MERKDYPRISEIMAVYTQGAFDCVNEQVMNNARERGTDVHSYASAYAKQLWNLEPEEHLKGYVDSFKLWYDENVEEFISGETRLYDDELMFSGKYDMIVRLKGEDTHTLIDMKTSAAYQRDWPVKLAAYLHLLNLNGYNVFNALSIRLKKDGKKPCVKPYGDCNPYFKIFLAVLTGYDYFIRRKEVA